VARRHLHAHRSQGQTIIALTTEHVLEGDTYQKNKNASKKYPASIKKNKNAKKKYPGATV